MIKSFKIKDPKSEYYWIPLRPKQSVKVYLSESFLKKYKSKVFCRSPFFKLKQQSIIDGFHIWEFQPTCWDELYSYTPQLFAGHICVESINEKDEALTNTICLYIKGESCNDLDDVITIYNPFYNIIQLEPFHELDLIYLTNNKDIYVECKENLINSCSFQLELPKGEIDAIPKDLIDIFKLDINKKIYEMHFLYKFTDISDKLNEPNGVYPFSKINLYDDGIPPQSIGTIDVKLRIKAKNRKKSINAISSKSDNFDREINDNWAGFQSYKNNNYNYNNYVYKKKESVYKKVILNSKIGDLSDGCTTKEVNLDYITRTLSKFNNYQQYANQFYD